MKVNLVICKPDDVWKRKKINAAEMQTIFISFSASKRKKLSVHVKCREQVPEVKIKLNVFKKVESNKS